MAKGKWSLVLALLLVTWGGMLMGTEATVRMQMRGALRRHAAEHARDHEPQMADAMGALDNAAEVRGVRSAFARARKRATKQARATWVWRMNKAREQAQEREDTASDAQQNASTKVGIHNVMGLGAPNGLVDQKLKLDCMMEMWELRNWSAVLLADVKYTGQ